MGLAYKDGATGVDEGNPSDPITVQVEVAVGDLIVVTATNILSGNLGDGTTCEDTAGNTFAKLAIGDGDVEMWWCQATNADSTDDITFTFLAASGYAYGALLVKVFTPDAGDTVSVDATLDATNYGTSVDTADATSSESDTLWIAGLYTAGPRVVSSPDIGGEATATSASNTRGHDFYVLTGSGMTADATCTISSDATWQVILVVFKSVAGEGATSVVPRMMQYYRRLRV